MSAVTIALGPSGGFTLTVPSPLVGRSHIVQVPATQSGLSIIRKVLSERAKHANAKLGEAASPTQVQVEAWLAEDRRQRAMAKVEIERAVDQAAIAGLNIGELDI